MSERAQAMIPVPRASRAERRGGPMETTRTNGNGNGVGAYATCERIAVM